LQRGERGADGVLGQILRDALPYEERAGVGAVAVFGQRADEVVSLEVQGYQVDRRRQPADRALDGCLLARDVDRQVDLEDRDVGSACEAKTFGVHARPEDDDRVDVRE
jgi:hypothetical protein